MQTTVVEQAVARAVLPEPNARRAVREAAGVSLRALARELGVSPQAVVFWETGRRSPSAAHVVGYVNLLAQLVQVPKVAR